MAGALVAVVLGVSLPSWPKILGVLNNAAHAPVFGVFALIALRLTREWRQSATARARDYVLAFLVATGVGGLVEVAQAFLERDASLADFTAVDHHVVSVPLAVDLKFAECILLIKPDFTF